MERVLNMTNNILFASKPLKNNILNGRVLLIGSWLIDSFKSIYQDQEFSVAEYHWDDRLKLNEDYLYLDDLIEKLLAELAVALNNTHGVDYSIRFWRILIGPWLINFTQIVFDRWEVAKTTMSQYAISEVVFSSSNSLKITVYDMESFKEHYLKDPWNEYIFLDIFKYAYPSYVKISEGLQKQNFCQSVPVIRKFSVKNYISGILTRINRFFGNEKLFIYSSDMPTIFRIFIYLRNFQFPFNFSRLKSQKFKENLKLRKSITLSTLGLEGFEAYIRDTIPRHIPTLYLEGFSWLFCNALEQPWPKEPKVIFTATGYESDEIFKIWTAIKVEKGSCLIISQHGGNIGSAKWNSYEQHELRIADKYFSCGWSSENRKVFPLGFMKEFGKRERVINKNGGLLLVSGVMPRYSYILTNSTISYNQVESCLKDQYKFVQSLDHQIFDRLIIRLFQPDWEWNQLNRWQNVITGANYDLGYGSISTLYYSCKICVATYNSTTLLETMSLNIPTIIFWNPDHWALREEAIPFFSMLKGVGIFHDSPLSASKKVNEVWGNVDHWWYLPETQHARAKFCENFAMKPIKIIDTLQHALLN